MIKLLTVVLIFSHIHEETLQIVPQGT